MQTNLVIKKPIITEKSMRDATAGSYIFEVDKKANKKMIAQALKQLFNVDAILVRTLIRRGKSKRVLRTRRMSIKPSRKFALVKLQTGQKIEGFEQVLNINNDAD